MRPAFLILAAALALSACESTSGNISGTADYDSLKRATDDCKARGGELVLKDQGNNEHIQDYVCKVK